MQFAAILLQLTKVPSLFPFLVLYVTLQRGSGAVCITVVKGGCEVREPVDVYLKLHAEALVEQTWLG